MNRPKDCICGFHKTGQHGRWCPSYVRLQKRGEILEERRFKEWALGCKIVYGKWVVGLGPKSDDLLE